MALIMDLGGRNRLRRLLHPRLVVGRGEGEVIRRLARRPRMGGRHNGSLFLDIHGW